ncbi:MAG: NAD-dependent epimerase [Candidatus Wenzhouxiangella sp. M2_3B_020]
MATTRTQRKADNVDRPVLVTGSAGFIGSHVARRLLDDGHAVVGIDNLNDYYDVALKRARLAGLLEHDAYVHVHCDLADRDAMEAFFNDHEPGRVIHLGAQAGVRFAAENPHAYVSSNVAGTLHVLEGCRHAGVEHLVFASTSSIYGANARMPYSESQPTEHPLSLYAATKKAAEQMAHSYAHLYGIPCTGLRMFTVYGPWGRPDMAPMLFTRAILAGETIRVFSHGRHRRSFTYIDDIVESVARLLDRPPSACPDWSGDAPDPATSGVAPFRIYNIGNGESIELMRFIGVLEDKLGRTANKEFLPMQPGDVHATAADVGNLAEAIGYRPRIDIEEGIARFVEWYLDFYGPDLRTEASASTGPPSG